MTSKTTSKIPSILEKDQAQILDEWIKEQTAAGMRTDLIKTSEIRDESAEFLRLLVTAAKTGDMANIESVHWETVRGFLANLSQSRARMGFTPSQTARFVFSLKNPIFTRIYSHYSKDMEGIASDIWAATAMLDNLGLWTTEVFQQSREEIVHRQQLEMLELSTPVVKLADGVLALPLIGTLDSARTQVATESLLQAIVETESEYAILDITGVPTVDTLVSQHLIKTVAAVRLMGADCIISGIRPQIAQTIVQLGVDLSQVITRGTLADAFSLALKRTGRTIVSQAKAAKPVEQEN